MKTSGKYYILRNTYLFFICVLTVCSIYSCNRKPKPAAESKPLESFLYLRGGKPVAILRVECKSCDLTYTVNHEKELIETREGNVDRFIYPKPNSIITTHLKSYENQMIRVLAINPNGKVISNILDTFKRNEERKNEYPMKYHKLKNTKVLDILPKTK